MHIGEKIKKVRQLRELTQEALGRKINLTRSAISFIELNGKVNHYTLKSILKVLNISEEDLMNFDHKSLLMRETLAVDNTYKTENELLKAKVSSLTKELEACKENIKSLKKLVAVLEKRK